MDETGAFRLQELIGEQLVLAKKAKSAGWEIPCDEPVIESTELRPRILEETPKLIAFLEEYISVVRTSIEKITTVKGAAKNSKEELDRRRQRLESYRIKIQKKMEHPPKLPSQLSPSKQKNYDYGQEQFDFGNEIGELRDVVSKLEEDLPLYVWISDKEKEDAQKVTDACTASINAIRNKISAIALEVPVKMKPQAAAITSEITPEPQRVTVSPKMVVMGENGNVMPNRSSSAKPGVIQPPKPMRPVRVSEFPLQINIADLFRKARTAPQESSGVISKTIMNGPLTYTYQVLQPISIDEAVMHQQKVCVETQRAALQQIRSSYPAAFEEHAVSPTDEMLHRQITALYVWRSVGSRAPDARIKLLESAMTQLKGAVQQLRDAGLSDTEASNSLAVFASQIELNIEALEITSSGQSLPDFPPSLLANIPPAKHVQYTSALRQQMGSVALPAAIGTPRSMTKDEVRQTLQHMKDSFAVAHTPALEMNQKQTLVEWADAVGRMPDADMLYDFWSKKKIEDSRTGQFLDQFGRGSSDDFAHACKCWLADFVKQTEKPKRMNLGMTICYEHICSTLLEHLESMIAEGR